ncbi:hypothetical protein KP509_22G030200 [Ceratopteris richardii]|uniref:Uncharacterized protein n=1 Tax=Ceratopteris richardii TaxID=49495 RepID=A0A8T2S6Z8_CERRI|nr:hypothetical protein KP509_22G030200 [Ceratopteris richardii]
MSLATTQILPIQCLPRIPQFNEGDILADDAPALTADAMASTNAAVIDDLLPNLLDDHQHWDLLAITIQNSLHAFLNGNYMLSRALTLSILSYHFRAYISILGADRASGSNTLSAIGDLTPATRSSHGISLVNGVPSFLPQMQAPHSSTNHRDVSASTTYRVLPFNAWCMFLSLKWQFLSKENLAAPTTACCIFPLLDEESTLVHPNFQSSNI